MRKSGEQAEVRPDVLREMHGLAERGADVRELVHLVQGRLGYGEDVLLPVLLYFMKAFDLDLLEVLPIREWLGTEQDEDINKQIMPLIARNRDRWVRESTQGNGTAMDIGLTAAK